MNKNDIFVNGRYTAIDPEKVVDFIEEMSGVKYGAGDRLGLLDLFINEDLRCNAYNPEREVVTLGTESDVILAGLSLNADDMISLFELAAEDVDVPEVYEDLEKFIYSNEVVVCWIKDGHKGISRPKHGEKYDRKIGEAVAYYKAQQNKVRHKIKLAKYTLGYFEGILEMYEGIVDQCKNDLEKLNHRLENLTNKIKKF